MTGAAELFTIVLLSTAVLYGSMLVYFNGLVGTKRPNTQIMWNSEPIVWILTLLFMFTVAAHLASQQAEQASAGVWYLIGAGNLLVVFIYLMLKLARHTLPEKICWIIVGITGIAVLYMLGRVLLALASESLNLEQYADAVSMLFVILVHILMLVLLYKLVHSFWSSIMQIWSADSKSPHRFTARGIAVSAVGDVSNSEGAIAEHSLQPDTGAAPEPAILHPQACIIIDFGSRRIEDHGFRSDLRIIRNDESQPIQVEVSNDGQSWSVCFKDDKIATDWDVPYFNNPWRYVRICNEGSEPTQIAQVYDLD